MANEIHVALLKKGVNTWNAWREENPGVLRPNFSQVDLIGTDLKRANLSGVDLSEAKNLTREQIESAVTDQNTRLPDYPKAEADSEEK